MRGEFAITIQEKEIDCNLNLNAFRLLSQKFKVSLQELDTWLAAEPLEALPALAYCAALNSAVRSGTKGPGDFEKFASDFFDNEANFEAVTQGIEAAFGKDEEETGKE